MNLLKKIRHEMNYLKWSDIGAVFIFLIAVLPSFIYCVFVKITKKIIYVVCEDKSEARDNGFCFFKYLVENTDINTYYAIDYKSQDYDKVNALGKTVRYGSIWHWMLYFSCRYNISSQKAGKPNAAIGYVLDKLRLMKNKFIFLQHGITINKAEWLFFPNTNMRLFICGAKPEYEYVKDVFGYPHNHVAYLGFPRFDDYIDIKVNMKQILLIPSWREWIGSKNEYSKAYEDTSSFTNTEYYQKYQGLINNSELMQFLEDNDLILYFYPHRNMQKFINDFHTRCTNIRIVSQKNSDIRQLLIESAVMITDYSSVALDFAYMKKPIIYYQFDRKRFREAQYAKGYFDYDKSGLGVVVNHEEGVVKFLKASFENNFAVSDDFLNAHSLFFELWDNQNCRRISEYLLKMEES